MTSSIATEVWRPVPGLPGYEASNLGRVLSRRRGAPRVIKSRPNVYGYPTVAVYIGGKPVKWAVHRLVATAFHGPRPEGQEVRHLDGDKANNRADNLRYGTRSENELDKVRHGTHQQARKTHCKHGHEFTPDNTIAHRDGRACRTCARASGLRYWHRRSAENATSNLVGLS